MFEPKPADVAYWTNPRHLDGKIADHQSYVKNCAFELADFNCDKETVNDSATEFEVFHPHRPNVDYEVDSIPVLCR